MRSVRFTLLAAAIAASAAVSGCQTTARGYQVTRDTVVRGGVHVRDGIGDAVTAPLEDLNLKRKLIPPILLHAEQNPYDLAGMSSCEAIAAEVGKLDDALGPDMDEPPPPHRTRSQVVADEGANATLNVIRDTTTDIIPMRGWVRRLTGAQQHSAHVQHAIRAGTMRRSYLKGVGMQRNCNPPAAPSWFRPAAAPTRNQPASRSSPLRRR
ncbi:MAG: hypothetical protein K1X35_03580 [Caulobacteraceae bacterium]|nr:hypothetical protein [Caulobacteraceae bacterium]